MKYMHMNYNDALYLLNQPLMGVISIGYRRAPKISLKLLRLQRRLSERLSKEILGPVASPVAAVTGDREHHFLIFFVMSEYFFETIAKVEKVVSL
jgi:hypothetical protein